MGRTLNEIAQQLKDSNKKVQLIYGFNGNGKTRLSREFKDLLHKENENSNIKIIYYNAFTEDLFYWDNDLEFNENPKLKIQANRFTNWIFNEQGQENNVITNFQHYASDKLTPNFNEDFSEITFSFERGNDEERNNIKISRGEESNLIWSIFYSLIEQVVNVLNVPEVEDRETEQFNNLEYIFIDDPVTSLDENHLIELAVNLAQLIKSSESDIKFIITTHNALFYNILANELNSCKKYRLEKNEDGTFELNIQDNDSPFSYHIYILKELKNAVDTDDIKKYHFNLLRNVLEKLSTFLGYKQWKKLLEPIQGNTEAYFNRIINLYSHSKHSMEEVSELTENDKRILKFLVNKIIEIYNFEIE